MTHMRSYFIFLILLILLSSCLPQESINHLFSEQEDTTFIYLQPLPQEAYKLRVIIDGISAIRDDGTEIPFSLYFNELKGSRLAGLQRLLASGVLTEGSYSGLSVELKQGFILGEEGESALLIPEKRVMVKQPFIVRSNKALSLFLSFDSSGIIAEGISLRPVFSLTVPGKELINLMGYVTNSDLNTISIFNKQTMRIVGVISTGRGPKGIVIDRTQGRAYVAVSRDDAVEVIDILKGEVFQRVKLNFGDEPIELGLTPDKKMLLAVNHGSNTVSIIDTVSLFEIEKVKVGEKPTSAVVSPSGLRAFIANSMSNTLSVVDLTQKVVSRALAVEGTPIRGAFNRNGDSLYVICRDSPSLMVIDPSSFVVKEKVFIGAGAMSITVDTQTDRVFAGKRLGGEISIIDPFSMMFIDAIHVEGSASFLSIDGEENSLFVILPSIRRLQKINPISKKIMGEIEVSEGAYAVAVMGER
jgi:YVTN family beta-propeller protein